MLRGTIIALAAVASLGMASAKAADMEFTLAGNGGNCDSCEWVSAQGDITPDTYKKLLAYSKTGGVGQIYLNSQGGSTAGAILLGQTIRKLGSTTAIGHTGPEPDTQWQKLDAGVCMGACALAFLGGTSRAVGKDATLGRLPFDDSSPAAKPGDAADGVTLPAGNTLTAQILNYTLQMGADPRALVAGDKDKLSYAADEAADFKLAWDPSLMAQWQIEPFKRGVVAFNKSQDGQSTLTLYCEDGHKTLLYSVQKQPSSSSDGDSGGEEFDYQFAGATIPAAKIVSKPTSTLSRTYYALPDNFVPQAKDADGDLSNTASAPHVSWFTVNFGNKGLTEAARVAFRNCI